MKTYITLRQINRKTTYFGVGGLQLAALFLIGLLILIVSRIGGVVYATIVYFILKKYKEKSSKGDPSYFDTWRLSRNCPEHLQDRVPEK